jgi:hypothetical protein
MKVSELIEELKLMPQDFDVCFWVGEDRVDIIEVRNVGDVVDLYEEEGERHDEASAETIPAPKFEIDGVHITTRNYMHGEWWYAVNNSWCTEHDTSNAIDNFNLGELK